MPYQKANFQSYQVLATFNHDIKDWHLCVLSTIALGQKLGGGWYPNGDIFELPSAILSKDNSHISAVGLHWASWELNKHE